MVALHLVLCVLFGKLSPVCADKEYYQIEYINLSLELLLSKICSFHSSLRQLTEQIKLRSIWPEQVTRILVSLSFALFQVNAAQHGTLRGNRVV